jgi:hypothetical protein
VERRRAVCDARADADLPLPTDAAFRGVRREVKCVARRARCTFDLLMEAWACVGTALMRAALAAFATNGTSKRAMIAVRTIKGTRRNLSTTSVRRSQFNLEC